MAELEQATRHVLVVVDGACTTPELCECIRAHAGGRSTDARILAPVHGTDATGWYSDDDAARADATHRVRTCNANLAADGIHVTGVIGDPDPVRAIADALDAFPADEILLVTTPQRPSRWLHQAAVDRARRSFSQPVTHVQMRKTQVLVAVASQQGSTRAIGEAIGRTLRTRGLDATVAAPDEILDVGPYDAFVIGSALYAGHWLEPATSFAQRLAPTLDGRPVWLFSSGPVGDPTRKIVQKMTAPPVELREVQALTNAREHRIFAGKLVGKGLRGPQRLSLLVFRGMEGDWRDWRAIERWAEDIVAALAREGHLTASLG